RKLESAVVQPYAHRTPTGSDSERRVRPTMMKQPRKLVYVAAAAVAAGSMMAFPQTRKIVAPPGTVVAGIPFSPGVRAGDLLHVAGLMGTDTAGNIVTGGIEAQAKKALENVGAVLKAEGM